jgi:hypothetical protein
MNTVAAMPEPESGDNAPESRGAIPSPKKPARTRAQAPATPDSPVPPPPTSAVSPVVPPDPFDPARLRMGQDFGARVGVRRLLTTVPVRKPAKENFIRTHPAPEYRLITGVIELKEDQEIFLVDPELWPELATETTFSPKLLVLSVTRQGVVALWPIRIAGPDGRIDAWSRSALEAADLARDRWVRVQANLSLGAYEIIEADVSTAPEFPALPMSEILRIAFKDQYIAALDHPVLRKLRGEL